MQLLTGFKVRVKSKEWKTSWVRCIWKPDSSLNLISPCTWVLTESWLRRWYTVEWAVSFQSVVILCSKLQGVQRWTDGWTLPSALSLCPAKALCSMNSCSVPISLLANILSEIPAPAGAPGSDDITEKNGAKMAQPRNFFSAFMCQKVVPGSEIPNLWFHFLGPQQMQ